MSAWEHLSGKESWKSARIPGFYLLSLSLDFISVLGKLGKKSIWDQIKDIILLKWKDFICLSIRIISISKVGCDFEMKIQTTPSPKAKVGCFERPFYFFLPLEPFCLKLIYSCSKLYICQAATFHQLNIPLNLQSGAEPWTNCRGMVSFLRSLCTWMQFIPSLLLIPRRCRLAIHTRASH